MVFKKISYERIYLWMGAWINVEKIFDIKRNIGLKMMLSNFIAPI